MYDPRMAAAYHARVVEDAIHENTEQKIVVVLSTVILIISLFPSRAVYVCMYICPRGTQKK